MNQLPSIAEIISRGIDVKLPDMPDWQGWNSDNQIFDNLVNEIKPKTIIEVGTWKGRSAAHWLNATANAKLDTKLYCVDSWLGGIDHFMAGTDRLLDGAGSPKIYHQFFRNFIDSEHANRIYPIQQTSINGARILSHYGIKGDIVYIDAGHEYEDVRDDLKYFWPLVANGGRMFGDDFRAFPGLNKAVIEFANSNSLSIDVIDGNFWVLK
jgi:hypothetical protein